MSTIGDTRGNAAFMTTDRMLSAINNSTFSKSYHLGARVNASTPAWGSRSQSVAIAQLKCDNDNVFNDDREQSHVGIGTHVDGLGHINHHGTYFGGYTNEQVFHSDGIRILGIAENVPYFITPFKLIDMARYFGTDVVQGGYRYTEADVRGAMAQQNVQINEGDIVLLRSGWAQHLDDATIFNGSEPGPGLESAAYLADQRPVMIAGDTVALEAQTGDGWTDYPVHKFLLHDRGIYIGEVFYLEQLASDGVSEGTIIISVNQTAGLAQSRVNPICLAA